MNKILVFIILVLSISGFSQNTFTLEQLINRALESNYQIIIQRNLEQVSENSNTPGNAGMLPTLTLDAGASMDIKNSELNFFNGDKRSGTGAQSNSVSGSVRLDYTVFDGFAMFARRDRLELLSSLDKTITRYLIEQTISDLSKLYYQWIYQAQMVELLSKNMDFSTFREVLESKKMKIGSGNALLHHQAILDLTADQIKIAEAKRVLIDLEFQIKRLINFQADSTLEMTGYNFIQLNVSDGKLYLEKALTHNADLQKSQIEELMAEALWEIEKARRYPVVGVYSSYGYSRQTNEVGFTESSLSYGPGFGLTVRMNLYDGGKTNIAVKNAQIANENANLRQSDTKQGLESDLMRLLANYQSLLDQYRMMKATEGNVESTLEIAKQQYEAGLISGYDFRQTQLTAVNHRIQMTSIEYQLNISKIDLNRISGQLVI